MTCASAETVGSYAVSAGASASNSSERDSVRVAAAFVDAVEESRLDALVTFAIPGKKN